MQDGIDKNAVEVSNATISRLVQEKFKQLDTVLNKRVIPGLVELQEESSMRMEQIERASVNIQKSIKKEMQLKFAKMREDLKLVNQETQNKSLNGADQLRKEMKSMQKQSMQAVEALKKANMAHMRFEYS